MLSLPFGFGLPTINRRATIDKFRHAKFNMYSRSYSTYENVPVGGLTILSISSYSQNGIDRPASSVADWSLYSGYVNYMKKMILSPTDQRSRYKTQSATNGKGFFM